jgi:hypothetical protein
MHQYAYFMHTISSGLQRVGPRARRDAKCDAGSANEAELRFGVRLSKRDDRSAEKLVGVLLQRYLLTASPLTVPSVLWAKRMP